MSERAYVLLDGVSCGWGVGDAVLGDGAFSGFPPDGERAGGGVIHLQVPRSTTWHWGHECA